MISHAKLQHAALINTIMFYSLKFSKLMLFEQTDIHCDRNHAIIISAISIGLLGLHLLLSAFVIAHNICPSLKEVV